MHTKIINQIITNGKTSVSEKILLKSIKLLQKASTKNHKKIVKIALVNLTTLIKVKQLKQKRSRFKEFPFIINKKIRILQVFKQIFEKLKNNAKTRIENQFVSEILQASKNVGINVNKRKSLYNYSFMKKKFAHYRWF